MLDLDLLLQEIVEVFTTRGYTREQARKRAERLIQKSRVEISA
jgi:LDH2 family malate/lactate/ureidoglycolate dehydrogenase